MVVRKLNILALIALHIALTRVEASKKNPMAPSSLPVTVCRNIFYAIRYGAFYKPQKPRTHTIPLYSDHEVIGALREEQRVARFNNVFDPRFDTRFYFTATARPKEDGTVPPVDPEAKALYIYLHGSGTQKASGKSFAVKANAMANMGYAVMSFDLPFHKEGAYNAKLADTEKFAEYLDQIIQAYRVPGQPVYLVGHSFGPDIIAEYLRRKPFGVDGAVLISPASYTKKLQKYFVDVTSMANLFWGDTKPHNIGAHWAGVVTADTTWSTRPSKDSPDPTIANPNLQIRVMSGEQDEYFPGKVVNGEPTKEPRKYDFRKDFKKLMKGATLVREPGVGHYIFMHDDSNGHDVVLRELVAVNGDSIANEKQMKQEVRAKQYTPSETALMRYDREPLFKTWVDAERGGRQTLVNHFKDGDHKTAQNIARDYQRALDQRMQVIFENIRQTEKWAPAFFEANRENIAKMGSKGFDGTRLVKEYFELLDSTPMISQARYGSAPNDSMVVSTSPESEEVRNKPPRPVITEEVMEKQRLRKQQEIENKKRRREEAAEEAANASEETQKKAVGEN